MQVIDNEGIIVIDVDDTIVLWNWDSGNDEEGKVEFIDPYDGSRNYLRPHKRHIALLKKHKGRGMFVIVWSAAGVKWAQAVVNTLGLQDYVDLVMTKPSKYVDDLPGNEILGTHIYLEEFHEKKEEKKK